MESSLRILLLTSEFDPFSGGIGTYTREIATELRRQDHDVTVVAPDYGEDQREFDLRFDFKTIRYKGGRHTSRHMIGKMLLVWRLATSSGFDVVHAVDWPFYIPLAISPFRWTRKRCLVTFHGTEISYMKSPKRRLLLSLLGFWNGWASYIGNSTFTREYLLRSFPQVSGRDVRAVPLGVSDFWHTRPMSKTDAREALGIDARRFVIMSVGRLTRRKGHLVVAKALSLIDPRLQRAIDWQIIGRTLEPDYLDEIRTVASRSLADVQVLGEVSRQDIAMRLCAADLFCLPGLWSETGQFEGFGLVYLEAAAFGVPSIASNLGGVSDAVLDGVTGRLVRPDNPQEVADSLATLMGNAEELTGMSRAAQGHAADFTWSRVVRRTYE